METRVHQKLLKAQDCHLHTSQTVKQQKKTTADNALSPQLVSVDEDNDLHHLTLPSPTTF